MISLPLYFTDKGKAHLKEWVENNVKPGVVRPEVIEREMSDLIKQNSILYDDVRWSDRLEGYKPFCCVSGDLFFRNIFTGEAVVL